MKTQSLSKLLTNEHIKTALKAVLGGAFIAFGTYASKMCPYPALAPLLFAVGILLVMAFDAELITRHVPTGKLGLKTLIVLVVNLLIAYLFGLLVELPLTMPEHLFGMSILGGAVIGLVSLNNLRESPYKVVIALLLMYIFVMLGLPHCVVYAFLHAAPLDLLVVIIGNILGGLALRIIVKAAMFETPEKPAKKTKNSNRHK